MEGEGGPGGFIVFVGDVGEFRFVAGLGGEVVGEGEFDCGCGDGGFVGESDDRLAKCTCR